MTAETQLNPQCSVAAEVTLPERQGNEVIETRERYQTCSQTTVILMGIIIPDTLHHPKQVRHQERKHIYTSP